jgi:spore maturation protein CgeB
MKLLYIGMRYDYGDPSRGDCYEYVNFVDTLRHMQGVTLAEFYFDEHMRAVGRREMNRALIRRAQEVKPDVCFFVLFTDEIAAETISAIRQKGRTLTVNWFGDDHWRFLPFSRRWAPLFDWVVTTDSASVKRYHDIGCHHVIKSQWGFNHHRILPRTVEEEFDVTFVGQGYPRRKDLVKDLASRGVAVECWGRGWGRGRLSFDDMITMAAKSRINLNFTDSSVVAGWKRLGKILVNRRADGSLHLNSMSVLADFARVIAARPAPQIKGRNFEVPGAGGFLLTSSADNLGEYFIPGKEIAVFDSLDDLAGKASYYLSHPEERLAIRQAGCERARRDHTYERRLRDVLTSMGAGQAEKSAD